MHAFPASRPEHTYAHIPYPLLVYIISCLILISLQEMLEPDLDLTLNAFCSDPVAQRPFYVFKRHVHLAQALRCSGAVHVNKTLRLLQ